MEAQTNIEPLLSTADCARLAGVRPETILDWLSDGKWPDPALNGYRCKRWRPADVERFLKTRRVR